MARNSILVRAAPDAVFEVLDDPYAYPRWVVGARRIRRVDETWPNVGSRFHHAVGTAAGERHDSSLVLERDRPNRILLEVRFRPTGVARVGIRVVADGAGSLVTIEETPTDGFVSRLPRLLTDPALALRNAISLQRLRHEIEARAESATPRRSEHGARAASTDGHRATVGAVIPARGMSSLQRGALGAVNRIVEPIARSGVTSLLPCGLALVVLGTVGRRTGRLREVPVVALRFGSTLWLGTVRSRSQWLANAAAHRDVRVWVSGRHREAKAAVHCHPVVDIVSLEVADAP